MRSNSAQNLLVACSGAKRLTIGFDAAELLRRLSDSRELTCPGCGATVILHAGIVRAHHFAHLPGAVCTLPASEPETEEHRAGKLLIARWLRERLPDADIQLEAYLPETAQRADVLAILPDHSRIALEYQCANLSAREWRRRHEQYRGAGLCDMWMLGGSRLAVGTMERESSDKAEDGQAVLRTGELERTLFWDGAPLMFLDAAGERSAVGTLTRFRPSEDAQAHRPQGRFVSRPLLELAFPFALLNWQEHSHPEEPTSVTSSSQHGSGAPRSQPSSDFWLWQWMTQRFRVTPETLPEFFGLTVNGAEAISCDPAVWQAAIYYRFVHRRIGDGWWLGEVETWTRAYLPLVKPLRLPRLRTALANFQEALAAAGMLSLPMGYGRSNARILADMTTLPAPPDRAEVLRLVRYRRTLVRENAAAYGG